MKHRLDSSDKIVIIRKRVINADSIHEFGDFLSEVDWGNLYSVSNSNDAYEYFLEVFSGICDLKRITLQNPWMSKGLLESYERNKKLYERFLKKKSANWKH